MANSNKLPPAIFIMGPTASGKTDLAMRVCDELPCEIISVDSALVYKGMDIGTAKPSAQEQKDYPHHLIDLRDPSVAYSAAEFRTDALACMADITARGKIPLLAGGSMMYFKILLEGMSELPKADPELRAQLEAEAAEHGWQHLHDQLREVDPISAERIHCNDPQRLQRALEVYRLSGKSMTQWREHEQQMKQAFPFDVTQIAIGPQDRAVLHGRIAKRFKNMIEQGFEEEVRALHARGDLHCDLPSIRSVGYRQMWAFIEGDDSFETMMDKGMAATRQLAKRQFTWLRGWQSLNWLYTDSRIDTANKDDLLGELTQRTLHVVKERL